MKRIEGIFRPERLDNVVEALTDAGFEGFTIQDARGHGRSPERKGEWRGVAFEVTVTHKLAITVIVEDDEVEKVASAISRGASTGSLGDGLIAVSDLVSAFPIRAVAGGA